MTQPLRLALDGPVATLTIDDGKGNAINRVFLESLEGALAEAQASRVVIIQGRERLFCGGLDLPYLVSLSRPDFDSFIALFERVHSKLLNYPRPIITCARGAAIAGGAVLLCAGDVRLVSPEAKVGINEVAIGFNFPTSALELCRVALGEVRIHEAATLGRIYQGDDCLRVGFATELLPADRIEARARELANEMAQLDPEAVALVREQIRRAASDRLRQFADADRARFVERWFSAPTQARLAEVVARLTRRR